VSYAISSARSNQADPAAPRADCGVLLSKLVYRSRAIHPLSSLDLYKIALAAQSRNRAEAVTGLMLYDKDTFFQWLEGPAAGIERLMRSIHNDPRHTDIEILESQPAETRVFADWSMRLAATGEAAASWRRDVLEPPTNLIESLRQNPRAAPVLLAMLVPVLSGMSAENMTETSVVSRALLNHHAATILKTAILDSVIPKLLDRPEVRRIDPLSLPINKRVWEFADLLIGDHHDAARELIRDIIAETPRLLIPFATLFEPAARRLGDLWKEDSCTELDVTLALSLIQTAARMMASDIAFRSEPRPTGPEVLITPQPGELHGLVAALDSEALWNIGWHPHCEFPQDDHALEALVDARWFDVLDLSLSAAFRRDHWLPRLEKTIAAARHASRNPALVVIVGGRVFTEHQAIGAQIGADATSTTALQVNQSILGCLPTNIAPVTALRSVK
jgi:hypothetical protein